MGKKPARAAHPKDEEKNAAVRAALISWFLENGRDLPWRRTRDPWRILVSEVMLQQIQVKRAVPFYERFLDRFPTVSSLAEAPLSDAIRTWGDLGRYRRVVNLHRTARILADEHGGRVPEGPEALVELPGIGPYTAGAVSCFAYERDVSFFDTNMHRVLHRVFFGPDVPAATAKPKEIQVLAEDLVPPGRGWAWNQAVMEFGALRCTARKPGCEGCPVGDRCKARPKMPEALAAAPHATKNDPGRKYEDSNGYLRGRVLARLREEAAPSGVALPELGRGLRPDAAVEPSRLKTVVEGLQRDGLVKVTPPAGRPDRYPAGAVAEERAAYAAGPEDGFGDVRVSLP